MQFQFDDVLSYEAAKLQGEVVCLQLSAGAFLMQGAHFSNTNYGSPQILALSIYSSCSIHQKIRLKPGWFFFSLQISEQAGNPQFFQGQVADRDVLLCGSVQQLEWVTPQNHASIGILVHGDTLGPLWESLYNKPLAKWLQHPKGITLDSAKAQTLRASHLVALNQLQLDLQKTTLVPAQTQQKILDGLLLDWLEAIPPKVPTMLSTTQISYLALVRRCTHLVMTRPDRDSGIGQLAALVGVSRRHLHDAFMGVLGVSPANYLRLLRMEGAHKELLGEGSHRVQEIGYRWGFDHPSLFAKQYKAHYGHAPSQSAALKLKA